MSTKANIEQLEDAAPKWDHFRLNEDGNCVNQKSKVPVGFWTTKNFDPGNILKVLPFPPSLDVIKVIYYGSVILLLY